MILIILQLVGLALCVTAIGLMLGFAPALLLAGVLLVLVPEWIDRSKQ